jgi:mRNA-degrading endonuclease HigB of HigAB toxin-antitoxin module
LLPQNM